ESNSFIKWTALCANRLCAITTVMALQFLFLFSVRAKLSEVLLKNEKNAVKIYKTFLCKIKFPLSLRMFTEILGVLMLLFKIYVEI
ncbi:hypothetical protein L9F63_008789, partial [Diploptera punctata]